MENAASVRIVNGLRDDPGVASGAGNGHARLQEHFTTELLAEEGLVLDRIVQAELVETVKGLVVDEFVVVESKRGIIVNGTEAPGGAFHLDGDVLVDFAGLANDCFYLGALLLFGQDLAGFRSLSLLVGGVGCGNAHRPRRASRAADSIVANRSSCENWA